MRYEFGFGVGFDRDGKPIYPVQRQEAIKVILAEAARRFGGCNLLPGQGAWINANGMLVVEESMTLVVNVVDDYARLPEADVRDFWRFILRVLNQEAVAVAIVRAECGMFTMETV